jgi:hypothetical protein
MEDKRRMYEDLAWLWPVLSSKEDYVDEGEFIAGDMRSVRPGSNVSLARQGSLYRIAL